MREKNPYDDVKTAFYCTCTPMYDFCQDPSAPSAEEKLKLKQSLVRIRTLIFKAAERFDVSYKEILAKAVTMAKEDHKKTK